MLFVLLLFGGDGGGVGVGVVVVFGGVVWGVSWFGLAVRR